MTEPPPGDYLQLDSYGVAYKLTRQVMEHFGRAVLMIVSGDGRVTDAEWLYLNGRAKAMGVAEDIIKAWRFDYGSCDLETEVKTYWTLLGGESHSFLYEAIKTARADGYSPGERAAVRRAANVCGIPESVVHQIEAVCEAEDALRRVRISLLHPEPTLFHDPNTFHEAF